MLDGERRLEPQPVGDWISPLSEMELIVQLGARVADLQKQVEALTERLDLWNTDIGPDFQAQIFNCVEAIEKLEARFNGTR